MIAADELLEYTEGAYQFAHVLNCPSLVFGCPKNRTLPEGTDPAAGDAFFDRAGTLAARYGVRLAVEANPPVYTNYLTRTADAFALVKRLSNPGLAVNLDLSTILTNGERLRDFAADYAAGREAEVTLYRFGEGAGPVEEVFPVALPRLGEQGGKLPVGQGVLRRQPVDQFPHGGSSWLCLA